MATQKMLRTNDEKKVFFEEKIRFVTALDLIKLTDQITVTRAPFSELPSNMYVSTMIN